MQMRPASLPTIRRAEIPDTLRVAPQADLVQAATMRDPRDTRRWSATFAPPPGRAACNLQAQSARQSRKSLGAKNKAPYARANTQASSAQSEGPMATALGP